MSVDCAMVLTTFPADGDADAFARTLVGERLAACVSVLPLMQSTYRWKGIVENAAERQVVIKTTAANVTAVTRRLQELHPYEVPEVLVVNMDEGSRAYLRWLNDSVS